MTMIKYTAPGYSTNGKTIKIAFNERHIENLIIIIEGYKKELCSSNQDIAACKELLEILKTK